MADKKKSRNERFVSPKGRFVYPWLSTPDTKFDSEGTYRLKLAVAATDCADFVEMLENKFQENLSGNKAKVKKEGNRPFELDEETNEYLFSFKMKAVVTPKNGDPWTQRPALFDASGQACRDVKVGGGTIGRISFEIIPYANKQLGAGISLRLKAAQILELVEFGQANAEAYGFEEEEGFSANAETGFEKEEAEGAEEGYDF